MKPRKISLLLLLIALFPSFSASSQDSKSLLDSAYYYHINQEFDKQYQFARKALEIFKNQSDKPDTNYAAILEALHNACYQLENDEEGIKYCIELRDLIAKIESDSSKKFAQITTDLGLYYSKLMNYEESESCFLKAIMIFKKVYPGGHPDLAWAMDNLGSLYFYHIGQYSKAEKIMTEQLEMNRKYFKSDHPDLAWSLRSLGFFYQTKGDIVKAEPLFIEALEMNRRFYKKDHWETARVMGNLGTLYMSFGMNEKAENLLTEALQIYQNIYRKDHPSIARTLNNLSAVYSNIGDYQKEEELKIKSLEMRRRLYKSDNPTLANGIMNMAFFYLRNNHLDKAEPYFEEGLTMYRSLYPDGHSFLARSMLVASDFYYRIGRKNLAIELNEKSIEMSREKNPSDKSRLAVDILSSAAFNEMIRKDGQAEKFFVEGIALLKDHLRNNFPILSENEKKQFWNKSDNYFKRFNSFAAQRSRENMQILCDMYDNRLFTKAILLNSTSKIKKRINNSGDSSLIATFQNWSDKKEFLIKLYKMSQTELAAKKLNIDSIETVANNLEKEISLKSEAFKQSYEKKKVNWQTIQFLLKPDEAAVETIRFCLVKDGHFTDSICYAFLIITPETTEHPEIIILKGGNKLESDYYNYYRKSIQIKEPDKESFGRYWEPLHEKLKGYKKVYFSADGIYNKLNPTTLQMPDGDFLLEHQDIQQVNTTKDIILGFYRTKEESNIYNSAVLVGNPNFELSEEEVEIASRQIRDKAENEHFERLAILRGLNLESLPGTEKEVKDIKKFLESRKWDVKMYLGDMALKSAVKSADNPRILHIATHGLFLEDENIKNSDVLGFTEEKMIENPLLRSGLFFSGAKELLSKNKPAKLEEYNGLLTAYEAMNMNLDKTELVVLSACETGLGEIQNGEGVFGLRRAFQQAGARNVLMSLWKVDDIATQELMSNFYANWVSGMTKRDAFHKAQETIKEKYKHPYYWGAFVLVGE